VTDQLQVRLKEIAKECGGNRALCEKSGVSERTFANWLAGSSEPKIIGIAAVAKAAGVTIDWIVNGSKPKQRLGVRNDDAFDTIQIAKIGKTLTANTQSTEHKLVLSDHLPFSQSFLESLLPHKNFDQLCTLQVQGDSMAPTMDHGDYVLVDRSQQRLDDGVYAFIFKDNINIKRVVNVLHGIEIVSDNKSLYPPHSLRGTELDHLEMIGRVIWLGKSLP